MDHSPDVAARPDRRDLMLGAACMALLAGGRSARAGAAVRQASLPRRSDVVVSIRSAAASADQALAAYRPNRLEWHYVTDPAFLRREKARYGIGYVSGTINANIGASANPAFYARDFDGNVLVAPWMKGWGAMRVSVAAEASRARLLQNVDIALAAGCDGIVVDDGWYQLVSEDWGGDFSDASLAGFGPWIAAHSTVHDRQRFGLPAVMDGFDYRDWLRKRGVNSAADYLAKHKTLPTTALWRNYLAANVQDFWRKLRSHVDAVRPGTPIAFNCGAALPDDDFIGRLDFMDYGLCELPAADDPCRYRLYGASAEAIDLPLLGFLVDRSPTGGFRQNIAAAYASGIVLAAPWDQFVSNVGAASQPRIFAPPSAYADMYDFVRSRAPLFDGYGDGARIGVAVPVEAYAGHFMEPLARAMFESGAPYRIIPVGGTYTSLVPVAARLAGLTSIVLAQPRSDFGANSLAALRATGLPLIEDAGGVADVLDREAIGAMVAAPGWTLVHRRDASQGRSVVHVVPKRFGAPPASGVLRLRHGTGTRVEQATRARVHRPGKPNLMLAPSARSAAATLFELPTITDWALVELLPA